MSISLHYKIISTTEVYKIQSFRYLVMFWDKWVGARENSGREEKGWKVGEKCKTLIFAFCN